MAKMISVADMIIKNQNKNNAVSQNKIDINVLKEFKNHPFRLYDGDRLSDLVESIKQNGILVPIIVRPIDNGYYEILSGHNRVHAAKIVGIKEVPVIIKENLSDEEAMIYVIETNLIQRSFSDMLPSEKSLVLSIQHDKLFSQGKRNDIIKELNKLAEPENLTSGTECRKLESREKVAIEYSLSARSVSEYLRINKLIQPLKEMIDENKIPIKGGVELSFINKEMQNILSDNLNLLNINKLNLDNCKKLRQLYEENKLNLTYLQQVLLGKEEKKRNSVSVSIKKFPQLKEYSKNEQKEVITKALEMYFSCEKNKEA